MSGSTVDGVDRYAVFGNPIAHSKSPLIHACFAEQLGQQLRYDKVLVAEDAFADSVRRFFAGGGKGLNITVPFKEQAFRLAAELSPRAQLAEAVNCLYPTADGGIRGDNTDGYGLVLDLREHLGWTLAGKRVLLLGAGGAARGVLLPLLQEGPADLQIANRTTDKACQLAHHFAAYGPVRVYQGETGAFDVVINGTSASLQGGVPDLPAAVIGPHTRAYDMVYGAEPTAFMQWAAALGAEVTADGFGMLVGQAAESFRLWRGVLPDIAQAIKKLR